MKYCEAIIDAPTTPPKNRKPEYKISSVKSVDTTVNMSLQKLNSLRDKKKPQLKSV